MIIWTIFLQLCEMEPQDVYKLFASAAALVQPGEFDPPSVPPPPSFYVERFQLVLQITGTSSVFQEVKASKSEISFCLMTSVNSRQFCSVINVSMNVTDSEILQLKSIKGVAGEHSCIL